MKVDIRQALLSSAVAHELIAALNAELSEMYPEPGATHFRLDPEEVAPGQGAFVVAWLDDRAVGCGAIRRIDEHTVEVKRMYVVPAMRGQGISRLILSALETEARRLRMNRLVLETGVRQTEALGLYRNTGFEVIEPFGEYLGSNTSVCMGKQL